jgi:S1-C subfamily serine protease
VKFDPLPLAQTSVPASSELYSFGHNNQHQDLTVAIGRFSRQLDGTFKIKEMPAPLDPSQLIMETKMLTKPGFSGGPIVNANGEVIGVNFASDSQGLSYGIPLQSLRDLIRVRQQRYGAGTQSVDSVPLIKGSAADRTEFTSDFADIYNSLRPGLFKIGGAAEGKSPIAATAFAIGNKRYFATSADAVRDLKWIAMNHKGMWQVPMELHGEFGGLALLRAGNAIGAPDMMAHISAPSTLPRGQRLIAMGYPNPTLEVHASLGSFKGIESAGNGANHRSVIKSELSGDSGLAGSPVVTKSGKIVGVLRGSSPEGSQIIPFDLRHPLLQELRRLQGI